MDKLTVFLSLSIIAGACFMRYMSYRIRKERLHAREKLVADSINLGLYDQPADCIGDGFIFCRLWRLSDIVNIGREAGYELTMSDCYTIIGRLRNSHDKSYGIKTASIRYAIEVYVCEKTAQKRDIQFDQPLGI